MTINRRGLLKRFQGTVLTIFLGAIASISLTSCASPENVPLNAVGDPCYRVSFVDPVLENAPKTADDFVQDAVNAGKPYLRITAEDFLNSIQSGVPLGDGTLFTLTPFVGAVVVETSESDARLIIDGDFNPFLSGITIKDATLHIAGDLIPTDGTSFTLYLEYSTKSSGEEGLQVTGNVQNVFVYVNTENATTEKQFIQISGNSEISNLFIVSDNVMPPNSEIMIGGNVGSGTLFANDIWIGKKVLGQTTIVAQRVKAPYISNNYVLIQGEEFPENPRGALPIEFLVTMEILNLTGVTAREIITPVQDEQNPDIYTYIDPETGERDEIVTKKISNEQYCLTDSPNARQNSLKTLAP